MTITMRMTMIMDDNIKGKNIDNINDHDHYHASIHDIIGENDGDDDIIGENDNDNKNEDDHDNG